MVRSRGPLTVATSCLVAVSLSACAPADGRPAPQAYESGQLTPPNAGSAPDEDESSRVCPPRTKRECTQSFHGSDGSLLYCRPSFEFCKGDGSGWHRCGSYSTGSKGELIAPD